MAWSTPPTFSVAEVVTATKLNQIRDDLRYLKGLDGEITLDNVVNHGSLLDAVRFGSSNTWTLGALSNGQLGVRNLTNLGRWGFWNGTQAGTNQTIISSTDGVTVGIAFFALCVNTSTSAVDNAAARTVGQMRPVVTSIDLFNVGGDRVSINTDAAGNFFLTRNLGTSSYWIQLLYMWR